MNCSNFSNFEFDDFGFYFRIINDANMGHTYDCLLWALRYANLDLLTNLQLLMILLNCTVVYARAFVTF